MKQPAKATIERLDPRILMCGSHDPFLGSGRPSSLTTSTNRANLNVAINFQPDGAAVPNGYRADSGRRFARRPSGLFYGWNVDTRPDTFERNSPLSPSFAHDTGNTFDDRQDAVWEMVVPNGYYQVRIVAGDPASIDADYRVRAEKTLVVNARPTSSDHWVEGSAIVKVTDNKLTIASDSRSLNNRIAFAQITRVTGNPQLPFANDPVALPGRVQAENFDQGRPGEAFNDTTTINLGNARYRDSGVNSGVDIGVARDRTGKFAVTNTRPGEWLEYSVSVRETGSYALNMRYSSGSAGGVVSVASSATDQVFRVKLPATGSWNTWKNVVVDGIDLPAGSQVLKLRMVSFNQQNTDIAHINYFDFERTSDAPPESIAFKEKSSNPLARYEAAGVAVDDKLYVFGGFIDSDIRATNQADVYDVVNDAWSPIAPLPIPLTHIGQATDGRFVYLAGGFIGDHPGNGSASFFIYDTLTNTYSNGPDLPLPRGAGGLALVGSRLHFFGGLSRAQFDDTDRAEHWSIDVGGLKSSSASWQTEQPMPDPRNHFGTAVVHGKIYAVGGQHLWNERDGNTDRVDIFDPATGSWSQGPSLPRARGHVAASTVVHEDRLYVVGGITNNLSQLEMVGDVTVLDPESGVWSLLTPMPEARMSPVVGFVNGVLIATTGNVLGLQPRSTTWAGVLE